MALLAKSVFIAHLFEAVEEVAVHPTDTTGTPGPVRDRERRPARAGEPGHPDPVSRNHTIRGFLVHRVDELGGTHARDHGMPGRRAIAQRDEAVGCRLDRAGIAGRAGRGGRDRSQQAKGDG